MSGWKRQKHAQDKWYAACSRQRAKPAASAGSPTPARADFPGANARRAHAANAHAHAPAHRAIWSSPIERVTNPPEATLAARTYGPQGCIIVRRGRPCHSPRARTVSEAPPRARAQRTLGGSPHHPARPVRSLVR